MNHKEIKIKKQLKDLSLLETKLICNKYKTLAANCEMCPFFDLAYKRYKKIPDILQASKTTIVTETYNYCPFKTKLPKNLRNKVINEIIYLNEN